MHKNCPQQVEEYLVLKKIGIQFNNNKLETIDDLNCADLSFSIQRTHNNSQSFVKQFIVYIASISLERLRERERGNGQPWKKDGEQ